MCVNYHGSSGFGQKFLETITTRYGEKEYADTEAATDFMLKQGYIDRTRLVATGGSYGGYMVAFMNGHTDRYKAYVCHAGCYDWVSMMATDAFQFFAKELGAFHWDDAPLVMRQSPHHYVKAREDADAGGPRRAGLPRAGDAGAAVLQHAQGEGRADAPGLVPRREPLDPEAAEFAALVRRILRVDREVREGRARSRPAPNSGRRDRYIVPAPVRRIAVSRCSWQAMQRAAIG